MKYLILDAGPIISMSMNGLLHTLEKLKEILDAEFIITPSVKKEVIDKPLKIKKFKLEAIKVQRLLEKGTIKLSNNIIKEPELSKETNRILNTVNGVIRHKKNNEKISLIHEGEASCLAFSNLCKTKNLIIIDERTTRLLFESPEYLKTLIEKKVHSQLDINLELLKQAGNFNFIRSAELIFIAYKKNLLDYGKGKEVLDSLLYALKFNGTTISSSEIEELKNLI